MDLLFFDIECASVTRNMAKICAFGYVLCNERFEVIEKEDILINPKGSFHLTDGRGERGLILPYEYSGFKNYPAFPSVYNRIKSLLEDKNHAVCGHATLNDVKYLSLETRRFHLPPFNFGFYDSQLAYMTMVGEFSRQYGLESIMRELGVEYTPHRAADDAYATMRAVKAMCAKLGCDFFGLQERLGITAGRTYGGVIIRPQSRAQQEYIAIHEREKQERARNRVKFYEYFTKKRRTRGGVLSGRTFNFSRAIEDDLQLSLPLLDIIYANGGKYSQKLADCNAYVREEGDRSGRTRAAESDDKLEIITPERLKEIIYGVT